MKNNICRISFIIHENKIFNTPKTLVLGISGGQDSMLLLLLVCHFKNFYKLNLTLVYCNHFWQKKNFYTVFELFKISYILYLPLTHIVPNKEIESEEQGHFWRQNNFFQLGNYFQTDSIILGHTATDQIETALWHFLRGTSSKGLTSLKNLNIFPEYDFKNKLNKLNFYTKKILPNKLKFKTKIFAKKTKFSLKKKSFPFIKIFYQKKFFLFKENVFENKFYYFYTLLTKTNSNYIVYRPLLDFSRSSISKLIYQNAFPFTNDITNQSKKLVRNKIRLILIPLFQYYIQTKSELHIKNFLNITSFEQQYLHKISLLLIQSYLDKPKTVNSLIFLPKGIQHICLKTILENYSLKQVRTYYIEQILQKSEN